MNEKIFKQLIAVVVGAIAYAKSVDVMDDYTGMADGEGRRDPAQAALDRGETFVAAAQSRYPELFEAIREAK